MTKTVKRQKPPAPLPSMDESSRTTKAAAVEVAALLDKVLGICQTEGTIGWITEWINERDEIEGYGYTVELQEEIEGLKDKLSDACDRLAVCGKTVSGGCAIPLDLSIVEQVKVEEFFRDLRAPERLTRPKDRVEELLERCRGFRVDELEKVLGWMDSYRLGELPFGPTDELREELREERERNEDLSGQVVNLRGERADYKRAAKKWQEVSEDLTKAVRTLTTASEGGPMDDDTEEKALFLIHQWENIPLAALRWIVEQETEA